MNFESKKSNVPLGDQVGSTFGWRRLQRRLRNWLLLAIMTIVLIDTVGAPNVLWSYRYQGNSRSPVITSATYYGPFGRLDARPGQYGPGCSKLIFVKPNPTITKRLLDLVVSTLY